MDRYGPPSRSRSRRLRPRPLRMRGHREARLLTSARRRSHPSRTRGHPDPVRGVSRVGLGRPRSILEPDKVTNGVRRSPAGPIAATCHSLPCSSRRRSSASRAGRPQSDATRLGARLSPSRPRRPHSVSRMSPVITRATIPAHFAAIANCDDARASQSWPVSGLSATTASLAEFVQRLLQRRGVERHAPSTRSKPWHTEQFDRAH